MHHLQFLDFVVILLYLLVIAVIGWKMSRRQKTTDDYFMAARRIPSWALGIGLMSMLISSITLVAHPGAVFGKSFWLLMVNFPLLLVMIFAAYVVIPFYRRAVRMSAYEYLGQRFGRGARFYASFTFIINRIQDLGFTIFATAIAVSVMTGYDIRQVIIWLSLFTIIYTIFGGIEGVIWTDVVQGGVFLISGIGILLLLFLLPPGGPGAIISAAYHAGKFSLGDFHLGWHTLYQETPTAWILFLSGLVISTRQYTTEQNVIQRYLLAKTDRDARKGILLGSFICVPIWLLFAFIGACLWSYYHLTGTQLPLEIQQKPDNILPFFVVSHVPAGLVGLFLAAILAAAQSTISADLNSVATVVATDYFGHFRPAASDRSRLFCGKMTVLLGGMFASAVALLLTLGHSKSTLEMSVTFLTIVASGMLGLFALGFLTRRTTRRGAYAGIVASVIFTAWSVLTGPLHYDLGFNYRMNSYLIGFWGQVVMFLCGYITSLIFKGYRPPLDGLTIWTRRAAEFSLSENEDSSHRGKVVLKS